jgi:hypothetical protein
MLATVKLKLMKTTKDEEEDNNTFPFNTLSYLVNL